MKTIAVIRHLPGPGILMLVALFLAACGPSTTIPAPGPTAEAALPPAGMVTAREGALTFLRTSANQMVPPTGAAWRAEAGGPNTPKGLEVYRFYSDEAVMTIVHPLVVQDKDLYQVAIGDTLSGFCWQALVQADGQVVSTGMDAQELPGLGNTAAQYCADQGNTFEVVTHQTGGHCGVCVFPDGSRCNAWGYFHGVCGPGDFPASGE